VTTVSGPPNGVVYAAAEDEATTIGRDTSQPPHDDESERAVFGAILKRPAAIREIVDLLETKDFYGPRHQAIWQAMQALEADNVPIDHHLLSDRLHQHGHYAESGGLLYLSEIDLATPSSAHIVHYAKIVVRDAMLRRLVALAQGLASAAWRGDKDPLELHSEMERRLAKLSMRAVEDDGMDMGAATDHVLAALVADREAWRTWDHTKGEYMSGAKTGFRKLDQTLMGMKPGDLIYLAARTSVGKSIVAQQIGLNVASHEGLVYYASLEMSRLKLMHRALVMRTGIPRHELGRGNISDDEYTRIQKAGLELRKLPLRWDTTSRTVDQIRRRAQRWSDQMGQPISLIVVDYVQLLRDQVSPRSNRYENVSLASHNLKDMAEALQTTVLAPAQVSREVLKRASKMPDLSDLRESGDLEQDADIVLGLDRADYHDREADDHTATIAVLKARDLAADKGRGTLIPLAWAASREMYGDLVEPDNVVHFRPRPILNDDLQARLADAQRAIEDEDEPSPPSKPDGPGADLPW
jgi:replicative DNA helicase